MTLFEQLQPYSDILFDLDNTIYDECEYDRGAFYSVCRDVMKLDEAASVNWTQWLIQRKAEKGKGYPYLFNEFLEVSAGDVTVADIVTAYNRYDCAALFSAPSLLGLLQTLVRSGKRLFLFTNGHEARQLRKIEALGIGGLMSGVYIASPERPETSLKPDPSGFLSFHNKFKFVTPVMVGDDITSDKGFSDNAGIPFIHFRFGETSA